MRLCNAKFGLMNPDTMSALRFHVYGCIVGAAPRCNVVQRGPHTDGGSETIWPSTQSGRQAVQIPDMAADTQVMPSAIR